MPTINWRKGTVNYTDEGKGPAVVLLHGFCESLNIWDDWQDDLLEEGLRVIRIDLPGFGATTTTITSIQDMADAVLAVCHASKVKQGVCVGHSMGGYVTLALAAKSPKWLIGIGLFHSHPYGDNEQQKASRYKSIEFIERNGHLHYVKQLMPRLFARNASTSASFRRDLLVLRASRSAPDQIIAGLKAMAERKGYAEFLAAYPSPVLFINGEHDPIYPEEQRQGQLALPAVATVCLLPGVGHMGMIEAQRETQRVVRRFVTFCQEWLDHGESN